MGDIAKGVLGGAWALLVGWIAPTALNLSVFFLTVVPTLQRLHLFGQVWPNGRVDISLTLLVSSVLIGLVLHALENSLYRILEGYILWPAKLYSYGCKRHLQIKRDLRDRIDLLRLEHREQAGTLNFDRRAQLVRLREDPRVARFSLRDRARTAVQRAILQEEFARYPVSDDQIAPTRLGNAIRRFEEYGYDRFRLDSQMLWHELNGVAPESVRRQVELCRTRVDFFVALFYGHGAVAGAVALSLFDPYSHFALQVSLIAVLLALMPIWYWSAVKATDEWAAAVRALVNVGRKPLAEALGFNLPATLQAERSMWTLVSRVSRLPFHERASALDRYRTQPPTSGGNA
ncbi:hypothetical protein ACIQVK_50370 [Streptomyces sp. NPDC090493]|uniref:hypothetical protein n=1 Tax=Streptomyces sp. NPDC090493 TaxID=3365964 RepID=UPI00381EF922